jgi:hypothetical protein
VGQHEFDLLRRNPSTLYYVHQQHHLREQRLQLRSYVHRHAGGLRHEGEQQHNVFV